MKGDNISKDNQSDPDAFTAKVISAGLQFGLKLGNHFLQYDTNVNRALQFQRDLSKCLNRYDDVYKDFAKQIKQLLITDFITKAYHSEMFLNSSINEPESK